MHSQEYSLQASCSPTKRTKLSSRLKWEQPGNKPSFELSGKAYHSLDWGVCSLQIKGNLPEHKLALVTGLWRRDGRGVVFKVESRYSTEKRGFELGSVGVNVNYNTKMD